MARTQISEEFGKSSIFDHRVPVNVQSSMVQLGRKTTTTLDIGMLAPVDTLEVIPGDYVNLSWRYILDSLPLAAPPYTPFRVRFHAYYARYLDLWAGASTYLTKGRNGNLNISKPAFDYVIGTLNSMTAQGSESIAINCPTSLASYLGLPSINSYISDPSVPQYRPYRSIDFSSGSIPSTPGTANLVRVNALPFFMYQKVYRRFYMPSNLLQDNKVWYPDDVTDPWRISYNADNLVWGRFFNSVDSVPGSVSGTFFNPLVPSVGDNCVSLEDLRYACFGDDTFTTALPFQVRGTPPSLNFPVDIPTQVLPIIHTGSSGFSDIGGSGSPVMVSTMINPTSPEDVKTSSISLSPVINNDTYYVKSEGGAVYSDRPLFVNIPNFSGTLDSQLLGRYGASISAQEIGTATFNLNSLRQLIALSVWQERNTRTNGNYNSLIYAHFGDNPDYDDFEPRYLGGSSDVVYFNEVVQTSESSDSNPLGSIAGLGHSDKTSDIINFKVPDYGYIMIIANIMPDVSYTQGLERMYTRLSQEEEYFPEYNALGFQAVLNKEIYATGVASEDDDVFGWQERNLDFKIRRSRATGLFALPPASSGQATDAMFSAHVMNRYFGSLPKLSAQFVTASPDNIRRDWLAYPNLPAFKLDFATDISVRRNIPYQNIPETFGF